MLGRFFLTVSLVLFLPLTVSSAGNNEKAWDALREGRAVLMIRHALAPGTGDPGNLDINDCSTQRNLNDTGREQARAWKPFLAKHDIDEARVFSSQWCRCMDTATGMDMGMVTEWPALNSFFRNRRDGQTQTQQTITLANQLGQGAPVILVSHQVNITALTGIFPASNEGVIMALPLSDDSRVLARVSPGR
ncbi:histidine phosphatase family protein [Marinobacter sp. F3R08]|uniref:histidine phosphatase family protein n=1 Tax=Marinobacter sp. F3R08 TaxID=2841559 RepID=UPI001C096274|nr:histidine phosphatase family protein [Marinobacter sp. F3R08]MBU2954190.1 histidine phosphatase family protein [Marinobacter sp. F3R08]